MIKKEPYYLTTAIAYTSGRPHIGNTYEIILSDAIARFKRAQGYDVFFQTGTDEHGIKIEEKAKAAGVTPQQFVDEVAGKIRSNWDLMNTSYDYFVRTTDEQHVKTVQKIFKKLYDQGDIYKGYYEGLYCTPCESFWTESQLVDGCCPDCGRPVQPAKEEAYFFNMQKYAGQLTQYIEEHPDFIQPESRRNEMINNFIKPGLQDLCVSRSSFTWGVPVDFDDKHVVYVWIDALSNYITTLGYNPDGESGEMYKKYWPGTHIIGKDILRFHTIIWPIILMALGEPLPKKVFGHPWLLIGDGKMSKSKGNVIYAEELVEAFGVDAVRYYCLHEMPFAQDGTITWDLVIERINSDLANILGNLVSRTIAMENKYFDGVVTNPGVEEDVDKELKEMATSCLAKVEAKMENFHVVDALNEIFALLRRSNKYIDETMPWALAKEEDKKDRLATVLYNLLEAIRISAVLLESYLPETGKKILDAIGTEKRDFDTITEFGQLETEIKVAEKMEPLFARIDAAKFMKEVENQKEAKKKAEEPKITIEDFSKVELKVGTVKECYQHEEAKHLLVCKVDLGKETRQIVSGISKYYKPEELLGKQVVVVTNLAPTTIHGIESNGMILSADSKKKTCVITPDKEVKNGSTVR
ncbi:MAG: methionine--tRNA ligase [Bacillota bacterium]|nr:methionine--tRNA ligase [Bacillota bacterium]